MAAAGAPGPDSSHGPARPATKPERLVVVAGTGDRGRQDLGWALPAQDLRDAGGGWRRGARPVLRARTTHRARRTAVLGLASGEPPTTVCVAHRWYPSPWPRPWPARASGTSLHAAELPRARVARGPGAGRVDRDGRGVRSPLADTVTTGRRWCAARARRRRTVADAGLGTIKRRPLRARRPLVASHSWWCSTLRRSERAARGQPPVAVRARRLFPSSWCPATKPRWPSSLREQRVRGEDRDLDVGHRSG